MNTDRDENVDEIIMKSYLSVFTPALGGGARVCGEFEFSKRSLSALLQALVFSVIARRQRRRSNLRSGGETASLRSQ
jgi:hypothetical protein